MLGKSFFDTIDLYIMGLLAGLRIGKFYDKPDKLTPLRALALWESAKKHSVAMYEFRILKKPLDLYVAHFLDQTIVFRGLPGTNQVLPDISVLKKPGIPFATADQTRNKTYHITMVEGQVSGVVRLDPAFVMGNGHLNIRALVEIENKHTQRNGHHFHPIKIDDESTAELKRQGLTWDSIPSAGQIIQLGQKGNRLSGGATTDVTDLVHPENISLFHHIASLLAQPVLAFDFKIEDISKSWHLHANAGIDKIYNVPLLDLHTYPMHGRPRNVADAIWKMIITTLVNNARSNPVPQK